MVDIIGITDNALTPVCCIKIFLNEANGADSIFFTCADNLFDNWISQLMDMVKILAWI